MKYINCCAGAGTAPRAFDPLCITAHIVSRSRTSTQLRLDVIFKHTINNNLLLIKCSFLNRINKKVEASMELVES